MSQAKMSSPPGLNYLLWISQGSLTPPGLRSRLGLHVQAHPGPVERLQKRVIIWSTSVNGGCLKNSPGIGGDKIKMIFDGNSPFVSAQA